MKASTLAKPLILTLVLGALAASTAGASPVAERAPEFAWGGAKPAALKSLRGQPVVLIIASSPESPLFRKQVARLQAVYSDFASRATVFAAAFTEPENGETVIPSNIPFLLVKNGPGVAAAYGAATPFSLFVIGKDGNLDLRTAKLSPASRVRDAILNNAELQTAERRETAELRK